MKCERCESQRLATVTAKCDDHCAIQVAGTRQSDYVPSDMGIGGGDYLRFTYCLACGNIQGKWPLATTELEESNSDI